MPTAIRAEEGRADQKTTQAIVDVNEQAQVGGLRSYAAAYGAPVYRLDLDRLTAGGAAFVALNGRTR
jgi:hypothetical protein